MQNEGPLKLHKGQEAVLDSKARWIGALSGVQGGKTTVGAIWLNREIYDLYSKGIRGDFLIAAPTNKILEQSTLPKYRAFFPPDWGTWKEGRHCFELAWEHPTERRPCRIFVRSTDEPDHLEGMTILRAWLDEAGQMKEDVWINIQGRLSIHRGRAIFTTTPYSFNWFYRELIKNERNDPDRAVYSWKSKDNPAFSDEEYEKQRSVLPKAIFERRYEGKFTKLEGLVYADFDPDKHLVEPFNIPDNWRRFGGMDFGHSNPTAILLIAENPANNLFYVYKEFYQEEASLQEMSVFLHNNPVSVVWADSQGAQNISELQKFHGNRNVRPTDKTKNQIGYERVVQLLKEGRIKFFDGRTKHTVDEMEEYHWKAGADKPEKKNDHCMDALKYAFSQATPAVYPGRIDTKNTIKARVRARLSQMERNTDKWTGY